MPHTYNNLFEKVCDFKNLHSAYLKARKGKRYTCDVLEFSRNLEENLCALRQELLARSYKTGVYRQFYVYEPKKRLVKALPFKDRVVHHALCNIIEPIFDKGFIYDSYACRVGKGTHRAVEQLAYYLRKIRRGSKNAYCLKADIAKYFPSIDHRILIKIIAKKIKCSATLWLVKEIINSGASLGKYGNAKDLPIGNLTSQLFANVYLNEMDYFIKHRLRCSLYVRYMDDFVILDRDKNWLAFARRAIWGFVRKNLALKMNSRTAIFSVSSGINFLGYRIWSTHRWLRRQSIRRFRQKLEAFSALYEQGQLCWKDFQTSIASWLAHARHADTYNLRRQLFKWKVCLAGE